MGAGRPPAPDGRLLVEGRGPEAVALALELADAGMPVALCAEGVLDPSPGGALGSTLYDQAPRLTAVLNHPGIELLERTAVVSLAATEDGLEAVLRRRPEPVDPARCTACGKCVPVCPVELPAAPGAPARRAAFLPPPDLGPQVARIEKAGRAPCRTACPIGVNAQGYVALIAAGRFAEALALVRERNPLPGICGRVCTHPCEAACRRGRIDAPVDICRLKRFVADVEIREGEDFSWPEPERERTGRVAVVGSGPAGLAAAHALRRLGHPVTVFEARESAGGLLRHGIPAYRLPREILDREIALIEADGVELRTGFRVEGPRGVDTLLAQGFDAVILATGAPRDRSPGLPGEDLDGAHGALGFLRATSRGEPPAVGRRVAVVGGGNAAIDAARTALRLGAAEVTILYRRGEEEMPALRDEVEAARDEGVALRTLADPVAVLGESGRVRALRCVRTALGEPDASGRRRPEPVAGSEFEVGADCVVFAIGQQGDPALAGDGVALGRGGRIEVDALGATGRAGVFAAGDASRGPDSVIRAMADGQRAALAAHGFLTGTAATPPDWAATDFDSATPLPGGFAPAPRLRVPHLPSGLRARAFDEVEGTFRVADAVAEAARCLQCGSCCECGACVRACGEAAAIDHGGRVETFSRRLLGAVRAGVAVMEGPAGVGPEPVPDSGGIEPELLPDAGRLIEARAAKLAELPAPRRAVAEGGSDATALFLCTCNGSILHRDAVGALAAEAGSLPGVGSVAVVNAACQPEGAAAMAAALAAGTAGRILLAACLCCPLEILCGSCTHQRARAKRSLYDGSGVPAHRLATINLRDEVLNQEALGSEDALRLGRRLLRAGAAWAGATSGAAGDARRAVPADRMSPLALPGARVLAAAVAADLCRGCGTCVRECPQEAVALLAREGGVPVAAVEPARCTLCGRCLAVCPTGAPDAPFAGHGQVRAALAAALAGEEP